MGRKMNRLRHQSPTSSKDIVAKFFGKNGMSKSSFRWNRPVNASMDHKAIQKLIEVRKLKDMQMKERQNLSTNTLERINKDNIEANISDSRNALLGKV